MTEDKKGQEEEVIPNNLVLYIGEDSSYFADLEAKFKELYTNSTAVFSEVMAHDESSIQSLILEIRRLRPKLIFIDYSTHTNAMLHITRVWLRQNFHGRIEFIGLVDYAQGRTLVKKAVLTSLKCVHVKSTEFEAICFDIQVLAFPEQVEAHGFATAKLNEPYKVYVPCKITTIGQKNIRVESNLDLSSSKEHNLQNFLLDEGLLPQSLVKLDDQQVENLYYNFKYAQFFSPLLQVEVKRTDDMSDEKLQELEIRNKEIADSAQMRILKWIENNKSSSTPKFIKTLVIDKSDSMFDDRPMSDSYGCVFRTQAYLREIKQELLSIKPHIIVFQLEKVSEEELKANEDIAYTFNTGSILLKIIQVIQNKGANYRPYIIAFNTVDKSTEVLQKTFNYQNIIGVHEPIQVDLVVKMCDLLRAKVEPELLEQHRQNLEVILGKNDSKTYAEIESEITVKALSETDIYFDSSEPLATGTVFRTKINEDFFVTVMPMPAFASQEAEYFGLIHGIGEKEKPAIRQFINNIFFRELQEKKAEEAREVAEQKRKYLQEKEAEKQRELEEQRALEDSESQEDVEHDETKQKAESLVESIDEIEPTSEED